VVVEAQRGTGTVGLAPRSCAWRECALHRSVGEEFPGRPALNLSIGDEEQLPGEMEGEMKVVGCHDDRRNYLLRDEAFQKGKECRLVGRVQVRRGSSRSRIHGS
jgi:hypothetical protein